MRVVTEPLIKVTLNFYAKDVRWFKRRHKIGYTEAIRDALRLHIQYVESMEGGDEEPRG